MRKTFSVLALLLFAVSSFAQWNPNTSVNLEVATLPVMDMQSVTTSTGKTWVAYYHNNNGNYDMRAQLLDVDGTKLLGSDGMLVDNKPSGSATFVFNICLDANDNLVIAYQDQRTGGSNMSAVAYKISQTGAHLWNSSGVVLGLGLAPYPAVLSNGETVIAWNESSTNTLRIQKINTAGTLAWTTPITVQVGTTNTTRGQLVAGTNGNFTMVFQKRGIGISTTLYAQRYNSSGTAVWTAPVQLSTQTTSGARYYSVLGEGDVTYCGYYASQGSRFNSWLQRINEDGTLPYGMNGAAFSTATGTGDPYQQMTNIALESGSSFVWSICSYSNTNQNQYGVYVQKFSKQTGARLFTDNALNVYPISSSFDTQAGDVSLVNDAPVFMSYDANYKIYATRLDGNGAFVWTGNRIELSSTTATAGSPKGRFGFTALSNSQAVAVWAETRNGVEKAYAQNISPGGLFVLDVATQGNVPATISTSAGTLQMVSTIFPSNANQAVTWSIVPGTGTATISTTGLVTASSNGTVWAKAIAVQDNTVADSLLITISNQGPVGPPGFSFNSPSAAVVTCPAPSTMSITLASISSGGFTGAITLSASGQPAGTTVSFGTNPLTAGNSTTVTLNGTNQLPTGTYTISVQGTATGVSAQAVNLTYTINSLPTPVITTQPVNQTICVGAAASFTVASSGGTLQWQQSLNGCDGPWTNINGATNATYSVSNATLLLDNTAYRCVVTNACGVSINSNCALLLVIAPATILTQPLPQTVCAGAGTSFTTAGGGTNLQYQWQVNTGTGFVNVTNGPAYSGATSAVLTIAATTVTMDGYQYRCLISNTVCTSPATTNAVALTVNSLPSITTQPQSQTICIGSAAQFIVAGLGSGVQYQWQVNTGSGFVNLVNNTTYTGATSTNLNIANATTAMSGYQYRCVVSGSCTPAVNSASATLTVHAPASINTSPSSVEICAGSNVVFMASGSSTTAVRYQWQLSVNAGTSWSDITGATNDNLSLTAVPISMNGNRYRCVVSNSTCTTPVASAAALLTVRATPTISLSASPLSSLLPGQSTSVLITGSGSTGGVVSSNWTLGGQPITPTSSNSHLVTTANTGIYQVAIRETWPSGLSCSSQSNTVTINVTLSDKLFIFPSPNDGNFSVSYYYSGTASAKRQVTIFDGKGALVYQREFTVSGSYTILPIDLRNKATGIYYLVLGDAAGNKLAEGKVHVH
jgi:hypothetical protein